MVEAPILKENPSKETLVALLTSAVEEARKVDGNVLGVVLYGSRSQGDGFARPDSDVDVLYVLRAAIKSASSSYLLHDLIKSRLEPYGIEIDWQGNIHLGWIDDICLKQEMVLKCQVLDNNSVFIIPDPEIAQKIIGFVQPESREWSRERLRRMSATLPQILRSD